MSKEELPLELVARRSITAKIALLRDELARNIKRASEIRAEISRLTEASERLLLPAVDAMSPGTKTRRITYKGRTETPDAAVAVDAVSGGDHRVRHQRKRKAAKVVAPAPTGTPLPVEPVKRKR